MKLVQESVIMTAGVDEGHTYLLQIRYILDMNSIASINEGGCAPYLGVIGYIVL